jgi:putative two-component system response regulator
VVEHESVWQDARILIVDDEEINIRLLRQILEPVGYRHLASTTDSREVLALAGAFEPDLILLDIKMPHLDGHAVLDQLRSDGPSDSDVPVLVLTSDGSRENMRRALSNGAQDFLAKPLSPVEVRLRVRNLLETRFLHRSLRQHNALLEQRVCERTADLVRRTEELVEARAEILERLGRAAEFRDDATGRHTQRVARNAALVAGRLGLPEEDVELIRRAAPLHDIGKIGVPDGVLLKQGRLSPAEFEMMKTHTVIGADILAGSAVPLLEVGREIAASHHEWWDGSGYPYGLAGDVIPLAGRVVAAADVFDALTHERPYKPAWAPHAAIAEIRRGSGVHFDPQVAHAFVRLFDEGSLADVDEAGDVAQGATR